MFVHHENYGEIWIMGMILYIKCNMWFEMRNMVHLLPSMDCLSCTCLLQPPLVNKTFGKLGFTKSIFSTSQYSWFVATKLKQIKKNKLKVSFREEGKELISDPTWLDDWEISKTTIEYKTSNGPHTFPNRKVMQSCKCAKISSSYYPCLI